MQTYEEFITKLYEEVIKVIDNIIDEEYKDEVNSSYKKYLNDLYFENYQNRTDYDHLFDIFSKTELSKWQNMSSDDIKSLLVKDEAFEKIKDISLQAYEYAQENKIPSISQKQADDDIKTLETLIDEVKDFNKEEAIGYIMEGEADLIYACGEDNITSIRMSR